MPTPRFKPLAAAALVVLAAWTLAFVAMRVAAHHRMTAEKVVAAVRATDLEKLSAADRDKRLRQLADQLNRLNAEERRRARRDREWDRLWKQMSETEKGDFVERTMPTGVKQMLTAFEKLSEEKRRYAVTNAIARMQGERESGGSAQDDGPDREPISEELQKRMISVGLKTFYAESSAQTKAEVAPLLEEMQRMMQSGRLFRR